MSSLRSSWHSVIKKKKTLFLLQCAENNEETTSLWGKSFMNIRQSQAGVGNLGFLEWENLAVQPGLRNNDDFCRYSQSQIMCSFDSIFDQWIVFLYYSTIIIHWFFPPSDVDIRNI